MRRMVTTGVGRVKQPKFAFLKQVLYDARMSSLQRAVDATGGQAALAARLDVKQQHVWNWLNRGGFVPPEHCATIERATDGAVTRRDLRPHDWFRIWPELVTAAHPAPVKQAA